MDINDDRDKKAWDGLLDFPQDRAQILERRLVQAAVACATCKHRRHRHPDRGRCKDCFCSKFNPDPTTGPQQFAEDRRRFLRDEKTMLKEVDDLFRSEHRNASNEKDRAALRAEYWRERPDHARQSAWLPGVERNTELARSSPEGSALHPTQKPKDPQPKLPPKKNDFSQYLNNGNLTDRQRECFSLKWEYGLPVIESPSTPDRVDPPSPPMSEPTEDAARREVVIRKVRTSTSHTTVSIPDAALYFEVKIRTVHRWTAEGKLRSGGRRGSITIESIRNWEKKRSRKRPPV